MIKRGSIITWHRPASDQMIEKTKYGRPVIGKDGKTEMENKHIPEKTVGGRCFGVINRKGKRSTALIMQSKHRKMIEVPFEQLEETDSHGD